jgi:hypothetical protein
MEWHEREQAFLIFVLLAEGYEFMSRRIPIFECTTQANVYLLEVDLHIDVFYVSNFSCHKR